MAVIVKYGQTRLIDSGKKGILRPDSDGYYEQPIGMLNCLNSAGAFYVKDGINEIMGQGSSFFRRIKEGALYAELEHPEQRPGEDMRTFLRRAAKIDRTNVCAHWKEIWIDDSIGERFKDKPTDPTPLVVLGKNKPTGPHGAIVQAAYDNPHEDVCFSVRSLTKDWIYKGRTYKQIIQLFTYDNVNEPGKKNARKRMSLSMESLGNEIVIKSSDIEEILEQDSFMSNENDKLALVECLDRMSKKHEYKIEYLPISKSW